MLIRLIFLLIIPLFLSSCSKPESLAQCMLNMLENQPYSATQYAKTVCERFFPPYKTVYDGDKDKISWKQDYVGDVLMTVPRDTSSKSYITYIEAQFSKEKCGAKNPRWLTAFFVIDYGKTTSMPETVYDNKVPINGSSSLKCMRVNKLAGRAKPPSLLGEVTSRFFGEDYWYW